MAGQVKI